MGKIGGAVWIAVCGTALMLMVLPGLSAAAEHGGMSGMQHGDHAAMHYIKDGEKLFSGKAGPWTAEAWLVDLKAQMEQSGVSAKTAARFAGRRHLMLFLIDPKTGKPASGVSVTVVVTGPDKASSSKVTLVPMGEHIGADVEMPAPGKYTFKADIVSAGGKGSATFTYSLK